MAKEPNITPKAKNALDNLNEQISSITQEVATKSIDDLNKAPLEEKEMQLKMSGRQMEKAEALYIKPIRSINSKEAFNEKFRPQWEEDWKYVKCIVENYEVIGESVEFWTKKYPGDAAHFWRIPVNKPLFAPRLVAKQLGNCRYHRFSMEDTVTESQSSRSMGNGQDMVYQGSMTVDKIIPRVDCKPAGFDFETGFK